jgi:hypothetical protein
MLQASNQAISSGVRLEGQGKSGMLPNCEANLAKRDDNSLWTVGTKAAASQTVE